MVSPQSSHVDGKVWAQNNGFAGVHRLDLATGKIETWEPFKDAPKGEPHNIYDVIPDSKNNVYFTDFRRSTSAGSTPRPARSSCSRCRTAELGAAPRPDGRAGPALVRRVSRRPIGMFDTKTEKFKEWSMPTRWSAPYDVTLDKNEEAWTGSMLNDRVMRLNTKTGEFTEYLLPRTTNIRRVFVDNSTTPVTFWVGNNHGASIIKLEPLD